MRIIINADDFGYNSAVNSAINDAIEARRISSSTLMANAPAFEQAVDIAKLHNEISFGVHLNIIEFSPLTNKEIFRKYKLTDESDSFIEGAAFSVVDYSDELKEAIRQEWCAQIQTVLDAGLIISHVDSHQHTHCIPQLREVLIDVMSEFGIKKCRGRQYFSILKIYRSRAFIKPIYDKSKSVAPVKSSRLRKIAFHLFRKPFIHYNWILGMKQSVRMPDDLMSYQFFLQDYKYHHCLESKTIELECHPGLVPNKEETALVMKDALRIIAPEYCLINYYQL